MEGWRDGGMEIERKGASRGREIETECEGCIE
jgi:hypothetical protein